MTRGEWIACCKKRAIEEMDYYTDPKKGIISMMSDLKKHEETNYETLQALCLMFLSKNMTRQETITFINGFC